MDESNNGACIRTKHTVSYPIGSFCHSVYQFDFTNSPIRFCHLAGKWCAQHIVCRSNDFFVFFSFSSLFHACMCWPLMMYLFSIKGFRKRKSIKLRTFRRMRTYMCWSLVCVHVRKWCMYWKIVWIYIELRTDRIFTAFIQLLESLGDIMYSPAYSQVIDRTKKMR